jgi:hypothetical protein
MGSDTREALREKIRQINASGGPPPEGTSIVIPTRMSEAEFSQLLGVVGRVNAKDFDGAPAGTLEILPPARWEGGQFSLGFRLSPVSPKNRPHGQSPAIDFEALFEGKVFPTDEKVLDEIKSGRRHQSIVPVPGGVSLTPGDSVIFLEAKFDPFGVPYYNRSGDTISVALTRAKDDGHLWGNYKLYSIEWDREEVKRQASREKLLSNR